MAATEGKKHDADTDLPKSIVKRIVKAALQAAGGDDTKRDVALNKDALLAFSEGAKVFVSYLTATANDIAREAKRQTISGEDVLAALEELEFQDMLPQLREALEAFRQNNKEKNKARADSSKKRKKPDEAAGAGEAAPEAAQAAAQAGADAVQEDGDAEPAAQEEDDDHDDDDMGNAEPLRRPQQQQQQQQQEASADEEEEEEEEEQG